MRLLETFTVNDIMTAQQKNYHLYTRMIQSEYAIKGSGNQQS